MKKEDAELKANALAKDLVGKEAEHKGSKRKCVITSVEIVPETENEDDFKVACFFRPIGNEWAGKDLKEEIDYFLGAYKILNIVNLAGQGALF